MKNALYTFCEKLVSKKDLTQLTFCHYDSFLDTDVVARIQDSFLPEHTKQAVMGCVRNIEQAINELKNKPITIEQLSTTNYITAFNELINILYNTPNLLKTILRTGIYDTSSTTATVSINNPFVFDILYQICSALQNIKVEEYNKKSITDQVYRVLKSTPIYYAKYLADPYDAFYLENYDPGKQLFSTNKCSEDFIINEDIISSIKNKILFNVEKKDTYIAIIHPKAHLIKDLLIESYVPVNITIHTYLDVNDIGISRLKNIIQEHDKTFILDVGFLYKDQTIIEEGELGRLGSTLFSAYPFYFKQSNKQIVNSNTHKQIHTWLQDMSNREVYLYYDNKVLNPEKIDEVFLSDTENINYRNYKVLRISDLNTLNLCTNNRTTLHIAPVYLFNHKVFVSIDYKNICTENKLHIQITSKEELDPETQTLIVGYFEDLFNKDDRPLSVYKLKFVQTLNKQSISFNDILFCHCILTNKETPNMQIDFESAIPACSDTSYNEAYNTVKKQIADIYLQTMDVAFWNKESEKILNTAFSFKEDWKHHCIEGFKQSCEQLGYTNSCLYKRICKGSNFKEAIVD